MNRRVSQLLFGVVILAAVLVGGWLRTCYAPEWWPTEKTGMRPWAVEADCYSQLARVQRILHGQGLVQNHFKVENWPEGLTPSTTVPFDYVILLLYAPLALFTHYPLDWAGALVSPALGLGIVAFLVFVRSKLFTLAGRAALVVGFALAPLLIWSTSFGRPRHQSLIVALFVAALVAEFERWEKNPARPWHIAAGIFWGMLCWTSLYEPLFAVVLLVAFNFVARRKESPAFGISFGVVMLLALLIEGVHVFIPPPEVRPVLERWLSFIAEMQGMSYGEFASSIALASFSPIFTWWEIPEFLAILALPWIGFELWRKKNLADRFIIVLTLLLMLCALFERRWFPYACLGEVFCIARCFQQAPLNWARLLIAGLFILNAGHMGFLQVEAAKYAIPNQPSPELAELARSIDQPGGVLAPWWLSPGLLYFSGQPIVSGSSHCGISGIEASAEFYASTSWREAKQILQDRKVRWVVVWDEPKYVYPLLGSSQEILGEDVSTDQNPGDADQTMAQVLVEDRDVPDELHLRAVTPHFKLYELVGDQTRAPTGSQSPVAVR